MVLLEHLYTDSVDMPPDLALPLFAGLDDADNGLPMWGPEAL